MKKIHLPKNKQYDSSLEENFHKAWDMHHNLQITHHHCVNKWELDFAFPQEKVGIELQGYGVGHISYAGMFRDAEKHNYFTLNGWLVLYFLSVHLKEHQVSMFTTITAALALRGVHVSRTTSISPLPVRRDKHNPLINIARGLRHKRFNQ